jgi:hypothetical protein
MSVPELLWRLGLLEMETMGMVIIFTRSWLIRDNKVIKMIIVVGMIVVSVINR